MNAVRAVVFDIGGVLERTEGWEAFAARWDARLGFTAGELEARLRGSGLGRDAALGRISEEAFNRALGELYGLDGPLLDEFVAARGLGMRGVRFETAAQALAEVGALLAGPDR